MGLFGSLFGGAIGFAFGGPIGAMLGAMMGGRVGNANAQHAGGYSSRDLQTAFTIALVSLAAKVAKADGRVCQKMNEKMLRVFLI